MSSSHGEPPWDNSDYARSIFGDKEGEGDNSYPFAGDLPQDPRPRRRQTNPVQHIKTSIGCSCGDPECDGPIDEQRADRLPASRFGVICPVHGYQGLNYQQYSDQLSEADSLWICPLSWCQMTSQWDDDRYERGHG